MVDDTLAGYIARQKYHERNIAWKLKQREKLETRSIMDFRVLSKMAQVFYSSNQVEKEHMVAIIHNQKLTKWL